MTIAKCLCSLGPSIWSAIAAAATAPAAAGIEFYYKARMAREQKQLFVNKLSWKTWCKNINLVENFFNNKQATEIIYTNLSTRVQIKICSERIRTRGFYKSGKSYTPVNRNSPQTTFFLWRTNCSHRLRFNHSRTLVHLRLIRCMNLSHLFETSR